MTRHAYHLTAPELVSELGESLYGLSWRRQLGRELGLSPTQMARWARGAPVSDAMRSVLREWARAHLPVEIMRAVRRIELLTAMTVLPSANTED